MAKPGRCSRLDFQILPTATPNASLPPEVTEAAICATVDLGSEGKERLNADWRDRMWNDCPGGG